MPEQQYHYAVTDYDNPPRVDRAQVLKTTQRLAFVERGRATQFGATIEIEQLVTSRDAAVEKWRNKLRAHIERLEAEIAQARMQLALEPPKDNF